MIITKVVKIEKEEIEDVLCNNCSKSLKTSCGFEGLVEATIEGGYDAKLGDGVHYTFSLCEECLEQMFKKFQIPAKRVDIYEWEYEQNKLSDAGQWIARNADQVAMYKGRIIAVHPEKGIVAHALTREVLKETLTEMYGDEYGDDLEIIGIPDC